MESDEAQWVKFFPRTTENGILLKSAGGLSLSDERGFFLHEQRVSERIGRDDGFDERICRARVACQDGGSLSEIRVDV